MTIMKNYPFDKNINREIEYIKNIDSSLSYDKELLNNYIPSSAINNNSIDIDLSSSKSNNLNVDFSSDEEDDNSGIIDSTLNWIGSTYDSAKNAITEDISAKWNRIKHANPADVWRMTFEKAYQVILDSKEKQLGDVNKKIEDIQFVKKYINELQTVLNIRDNINRLVDSGASQYQINNYMSQLQSALNNLDKTENIIKSDWKNSDIFIDLFTDKNKALDLQDIFNANVFASSYDKDIKYRSDKDRKNASWLSNQLSDLGVNLGRIGSAIGNTAGEIINQGLNIFGLGLNTLHKAIRNTPDDVKVFDHLFDSYRSDLGGIKDNTKNRITDLTKRTDLMLLEYDRLRLEKEADVVHTHNVYKNGNFLFDPRKIDPEFKRILTEEKRGLLSIFDLTQLPYNIPELGTSFSDIEDFAGLMAINTAGSAISSKLATTAFSKTPVGRGLNIATQLATVAGGLTFSSGMRRNESNAEVTEAYSSRLLNEVSKRNIDIKDILSQGEKFLNSRGIDTSNDTDLDKLSLMLAYDVPTDNEEFNDLKKETRKGLAKVYNDNNTLSTLDYLQALPFMNYTGSILKNSLKNTFSKSRNLSPIAMRAEQSILDAAEKSSLGMADNLIQKTSNKIGKDLSQKLKIYHTSKYLKDKLKKIGFVMATEGIEEGLQHLLQLRYSRGEYDDYSAEESMFYLPSIFEDVRLAQDAVAGYLGINFGDPDNGSDELRHAMNVGAIAGMFFPASHVITNVVSTKENNIRNLVAQLKNDKVVRNLVAENYGKAQDDAHVGIFFDAMSKAGVNANRLTTSLEDMKKFKGDLVTDEYIDGDIELLKTTSNIYNNPFLNDVLEQLGIKKGDSTHRAFVLRGVRNITDANTAKDAANKSMSELTQLYNTITEHLLDPETQKTTQQLFMLDEIGKSYDKYVKEFEEKSKKEFKTKYPNFANMSSEERTKVHNEFTKRIPVDKNTYISNYVRSILESKNLSNAIAIRDLLINQKNRLDLIRRETGTDINTDNLVSTINKLNQYIEEIKSNVDEFLKPINDSIDAYNKIIENINDSLSLKLKKKKRITIDDEFGKFGNFENLDEINKLQLIVLLNDATFEILNTRANAYLYGQINPADITQSFRTPNWTELSKELQIEYINQTRKRYQDEGKLDKFKGESTARTLYNNEQRMKRKDLDNVRKKYEELKKKIENTPEQDRSLGDIADLREYAKLAAVAFMRMDLDDKLTRMKIAHRYAKEEKPITTDDIELSQLGDENATLRIADHLERLLEQQESEESQDELEIEETTNTLGSVSITGTTEDEILDDLLLQNEDLGSQSSNALSQQMGEDRAQFERLKRKAEEKLKQEKSQESSEQELKTYSKEKEERSEETLGILEIPEDEGSLVLDDDSATGTDPLFPQEEQDPKSILEKIDNVDFINELNEFEDGLLLADGALVVKKYKSEEDESKTIIEIVPTNIVLGNVGFTFPKEYSSEDDIDRSIKITKIEYTESDHVPNELKINDKYIIHRDGTYKENINPKNESSLVPDNIDFGTGKLKQDAKNQYEELDDDSNDGSNNGKKEEDLEKISQNPQLEIEPDLEINLGLDVSKFSEDENGTLYYGDLSLDVTQDEGLSIEDSLLMEQDVLELLDIDLSLDMSSLFIRNTIKSRKDVSNSDDVLGNYIGQTFFYQPNATDPIILTVGKTQLIEKQDNKSVMIVNGRTLTVKSGSELSKQLVKRGWFDNCNKFYVVSQNGANEDRSNSDGFTVTLAIEDTKTGNVYLAAMRTPSKYSYQTKNGRTVYVDGEAQIRTSLRNIGVDMDMFEETLQEAAEYFYSLKYGSKKTNKAAAYRWYTELNLNDPIKRQIEEDARKKAAKPGHSIFTEDQIDEQIQNLKETRNEIIEAYCEKDKDGNYIIPIEVKDTVHPFDADISNGSIDNVRDETNMPVYRNMTGEEAGFGLSDKIEEIDKQLSEFEILFGFGNGHAWYILNQDTITNVFDNASQKTFPGVGVAGKIYIIAKSANGNSVPIMLREERFKTQQKKDGSFRYIHRSKDNLELCLDTNGNINSENTPSAAEVLLYLITGRINRQLLPNGSLATIDALTNLFINTGEHTLMHGSKVQNTLHYFADKQIAFTEDDKGNPILILGKTNQDGIKYQKTYTMDDLFGNDSEENRKDVIYTISENMHWNTDIYSMRLKFDYNLLSALQEYFTQNPKATEFKLCGVDLFSIKKEDLFELDENGEIIRPNNVCVMSWMLKTGKLMTDVSTDIFSAPFIYAKGVEISPSEKLAKEVKSKQITEDKPLPSIVEAQAVALESYESFVNRTSSLMDNIESKLGKKLFFARTQERKKEILKLYDETLKLNGGLADIIMIDLGDEKITTKDLLIKKVKESINKYIDHANKSRNEDNKLTIDDINISSIINASSLLMNTVKRGKAIPVMYVTNNKTGSIVLLNPINDIKSRISGATGVFSKERGKGKLNVDKAKKWLSKTLGIDDAHTIIINGLIRSANDEMSYGMMNVSFDVLYNTMMGNITLSSQAGRGVHYHEAWHYVNLLIHTKQERMRLYQEYAKNHPELQKAKFSEIEEAMAEEFRKYMEVRNGDGLTNKIKRIFNSILEFIKITRNKDLMHIVFEKIRKGKYSKYSLDKESIKEFHKAYKNGAPMSANFSVPGVKQSTIDEFKGITDYHTFYKCGVSLANKLLNDYSINTPDEIRRINRDLFTEFIDNLKQSNEFETDPVTKLIVQDVINNPQAFKHVINGIFKQYGLEPKFKKFKLLDETEPENTNLQDIDDDMLGRDIGDRTDFTFDIESIKINKKDNVSFRAKLFLSLIERGIYVPVLIEQNGKILYKKEFQFVQDDILHTNEFNSFSESWTKILSDLWNCESYDNIENGDYSPTSLRGMVKRLKQSDAFYESLDRKLDLIKDDIELQNQIYGTIKSAKPQIAYLELRDPVKKTLAMDAMADLDSDLIGEYSGSSQKVTADRDRDWIMHDDNALKSKRMLPRNWSKTITASGLTEFKNGKLVVSQAFADALWNMVEAKNDSIMSTIKNTDNKLKKSVDTDKADIAETANFDLEERLLNVIRFMGIPFDELTLDQYILMHIKSNESMSNPIVRYNAIKAIMEKSAKNSGSIRWFIQNIDDNIGNQELRVGKKRDTKPIDLIYYGFSLNSEITKMAHAYSIVHPSSLEFGVVGPDGSMMYPISQNNYMTDAVRWLNNSNGQRAVQLSRSPYAKHSILLNYAKTLGGRKITEDDLIKLEIFVGLKESKTREGNDYIGITPMEDYLAKMQKTFMNRLISPTMADKKGWYSIKVGNNDEFNLLPHDIITYDEDSKNGSYRARRFSDTTLNIFCNYFLDELNSIELYYSRDNLDYLVKHPEQIRENFHGDIEKVNVSGNIQKRIKFGGNGGKLRYFYDIIKIKGINLNQLLEFEYNRQKDIESGKILLKNGTGWMHEGKNEFDGYELVRKRIKDIKYKYFIDGVRPTDELRNIINKKLMSKVFDELDDLSKPGSLNMVMYDNIHKVYFPIAIPSYLLSYYANELKKNGYKTSARVYRGDVNCDANALLSAVGNHVASTMISIIEFEKVFSGDPAWYSWKDVKEDPSKKEDYSKKDITLNIDFGGQKLDYTTTVSNLLQKDADKIKRLGSVLSPGQNLRIDYSKQILKAYPELRGRKYINANVADVNAKSVFFDIVVNLFEKLNLIDYLRSNKPNWFDKYIADNRETTNSSFEGTINNIYTDSKVYKEILALLKNEDPDIYDNIHSEAQKQAKPYGKINVSDAQVLIRPSLYRKIKIGLGQWTFEEDSDGYSDEKAYLIAEKDGSWMKDPEKYKMVLKLQLNVLKMTYFMNDSEVISTNKDGKSPNYQNIPVYNKMAIFPLFKFTATSDSGKMLYDRMNRDGDEIDMISFESAVKVGGNKYKYSPFESKTTQLDKLNEELNKKSSYYLSKKESDYGTPHKNESDDVLTVQVLDLDGLRMLLNTDEHDSHERSIGTLMFKLAFSNIIDNTIYGLNKYDEQSNRKKGRLGKDIKHDIMSCINGLTLKGVDNIVSRFYETTKKGGQKINKKAVRNMIELIIRNNGIGVSAEEIIADGGTVSSLMSRKVFEQSVSSAVNKEIVDINTPGGSAIQLSVFGFVGYSNKNVSTYDNDEEYHILNNGEEIKWNTKEGSMEVLLSMNFFKSVVPRDYLTDYFTMRQWLIDNNIINGTKTDGTKSTAKPFGLGYRIPTLGMSSIFSFIVADVLPEQSADTIVVPREFTAQTGSDFDIDKLFIATMSYTNGIYDSLENEEELLNIKTDKERAEWYRNQESGAVTNRLLLNYIDIVTDIKNFANARASIDTITSKIQDELLPNLKKVQTDYAKGFYELTPSFQSRRKMEFSTGKDGIAPFALNTTNLALTQYTHLCMDYGENEFGFVKNLDSITGEDDLRISDWLSAMVNAHVDVAKDPYIFIINVNRATYNHVNFLLRVGKGLSTFTFISQPILKRYADLLNNAGGIYGQNIDGKNIKTNVYDGKKLRIYKQLKKEIIDELDYIYSVQKPLLDKKESAKWRKKISDIKTKHNIDWPDVFDIQYGIDAARDYDSDTKTILSVYFQLLALESFFKIEPFADELAKLVRNSQIDTKKFGNNIISHLNFENIYNQFKFSDKNIKWYINDGTDIQRQKDFGKSYALRKYFGSLFLDSKLYNAIRYTREILNTQTYTATPIFEQLFNSICAQINGTVEYNMEVYENGQLKSIPKIGYKEIGNDDIVLAIGNSIDNIIRYRMLQFNGLSEYNKLTSEQSDLYGPIDFTMNGNENAVRFNMLRLLFGIEGSKFEYDSKPLFENVAKFIHDICQDPSLYDAEDLVENGKIINEFLDYLNPQPASDKFPIGRLLLKKSQMNLGFDLKMTLISAFDNLLRHPSEYVRRLARDIAFYAYYSTYDTNTVNSFFDLVPYYYRQQYDKALKTGLNQTSDKLNQMLIAMKNMDQNPNNNDNPISILASEILDLISRNYWYDDNIVPSFYEHSESKATKSMFEKKLASAKINKKRFFGGIITTHANSPYFKITNGDQTILYKRIGTLIRKSTKKDPKTLKIKTLRPSYIYIAVHTLGLHQGSIHQYEFLNSSLTESIFSYENALPSLFKYDSVTQEINNYILRIQEENLDIQMEIEYDSIIPIVSNEMYYESDNSVKSVLYNSDNSLRFITTKTGDNYAATNSTIILDINSTKHSKNNKTISVTDKQSSSEISKMLSEVTRGGTESIYISGNISDVNITDIELKEYIEKQALKYIQRLLENLVLTKSEINESIKQYKEENAEEFKESLKLTKINQFIYDIINDFLMYNKGKIELNTIYVDGTNEVGIAAANAAMLLQNDLLFKQGYVILDPKYSNKKYSDELLQLEEKFERVDDDVILSVEEQKLAEVIQDMIDKVNQLEDQIMDQDQNIDLINVPDFDEVLSGLDLLSQFGQSIVKEVKKPSKNKKTTEDSNMDFDDLLDISSLLC